MTVPFQHSAVIIPAMQQAIDELKAEIAKMKLRIGKLEAAGDDE